MSELSRVVKTLDDLEQQPSKEPALNMGVGATFIMSLFMILTFFFPRLLTDDIRNLVAVIASTFGPILLAWLIRKKVWAPSSVADLMNAVVKEVASKEQPKV